jgi:DNA processing protein
MLDIRTIDLKQPAYQQRIGRLSDPPKTLFIRGSHDPSRPSIAVIGSRKHTAYGRAVTERIVAELARCGLVIISGLALGIDGIAQQTALAAGAATTAVMPGGLDKIYPASHRQLGQSILNGGGGLISEYPAGELPQRHYFVARNRLVAALADAILVIEAAQKSGTLITVEFALEMGLPVMAVPGPITSASSVGTNQLIQAGAQLISSTSDILASFKFERGHQEQPLFDTELDTVIYQSLRAGPKHMNELASMAACQPQLIATRLTHLELGGHVVCLGANMWSVR